MVTTVEELEALPIGSIIADFGPDRSWNDSAVIACKAARGDWTTMGGEPERRWVSSAIFEASNGHVVQVLHDPSAPTPTGNDREALTARVADTLAYYNCRETNPKADHPRAGYHAFSEEQREFLRERKMEAANEVVRMFNECTPPEITDAMVEAGAAKVTPHLYWNYSVWENADNGERRLAREIARAVLEAAQEAAK